MTHPSLNRRYGQPPIHTVVVHGGPGAGGEMAPVARRLAIHGGVLEPIQTALSLESQVEELRAAIAHEADPPVTLIGYSWGAWLGWIVAARYPALVRKLILVSSGPFEARYVEQLHATREARMTPEQRAEFEAALAALADPAAEDKDAWLARLGALAAHIDAYELLPADEDADHVGPRGDVFQGVWSEAAELRASGDLLALAAHIRCPVVALHGDHDPHPAAGVRDPLTAALPDFRFILLTRCGHTPWRERYAREAFWSAFVDSLIR